MLTTPQAAELVGVAPATIRSWRHRGYLQPCGLDERYRPLYHPDDVITAEQQVRANGLRQSRIDPRTRRTRLVA